MTGDTTEDAALVQPQTNSKSNLPHVEIDAAEKINKKAKPVINEKMRSKNEMNSRQFNMNDPNVE